MSLRSLSLFLVAAIIAITLASCNGPAPGLDPTITLSVNGSNQWSNIPAGATVTLTSTSTVSTSDQITKASWTQSPNVGTFLVNAANSQNNAWVAPSTVVAPQPVDLTLNLETLLGGKSSSTVHLVVTPKTNLPIYNFEMPTFTGSVHQATQLQILGAVQTNGADDPDQSKYTFQWTEVPSSVSYIFDHPDSQKPIWTSPSLQTDPKTGNLIPETHYLQIKTTSPEGYTSVSNLVVNVIP